MQTGHVGDISKKSLILSESFSNNFFKVSMLSRSSNRASRYCIGAGGVANESAEPRRIEIVSRKYIFLLINVFKLHPGVIKLYKP